ncbi:hypothetical protein ACFSX5_01370 [Devosia albogilva]|uniref:Uncharacterized protein n=1 Tax=Devosia albogilva TaxID=429726 RepID=A0ABW5QF71_9HYPH
MASSTARAPNAPSAIGFNLAALSVMVLLAAVGLAYWVDGATREARTPGPVLNDDRLVTQTIAGQELSIPQSWFRNGQESRTGFASQIDLLVTLTPPEAEPIPVQVTLLPPSRARTSASLLDRVYLHQFGEETLSGVMGLVGKPVAGPGYRGETVWYDPLSPNPFVAKCLAPVEPEGAEQCVRTVYLPSGIAAVYTFSQPALAAWREFDSEMGRWLGRIGAM